MARWTRTSATPKRWAAAFAATLIVAALAAAPMADAKKKRGGGTINVTQQVGQLIPDATPDPNSLDGILVSTIQVGKRKGRLVRDVNATVHTTATGNMTPGQDLVRVFLTAPNGATTFLVISLFGSSIGPLTLDDESRKYLINDDLATNPFELPAPYLGAARPPFKQLAVMDNGPVSGTWTLVALDVDANPAGRQAILNSWGLRIVTGRPYRTR
jgi:hypothetical protein